VSFLGQQSHVSSPFVGGVWRNGDLTMRDRDKNARWRGTAGWDQNSGGMRDSGTSYT